MSFLRNTKKAQPQKLCGSFKFITAGVIGRRNNIDNYDTDNLSLAGLGARAKV